MHVINLGYLRNRLPYFIEFLDSNIEKFNRILVRLDNAAGILDNDDKHLLNLSNWEAKRTKKKKAQRYQLRKIKLVQVISSIGIGNLLSFVASDNLLSAISDSHLLSSIVSGGLLSAIYSGGL